MPPICPYCNNSAMLIDSSEVYAGRSFGLIWACARCDAYVGVHKDSPTYKPKGTLANKELRVWRVRAHSAFDPLWRSLLLEPKMTRTEAYTWMQETLAISRDQAHIGSLDVEGCRRLIAAISSLETQ